MLTAIWTYRFFILSSIRNELRLRFVRSKLGGLWMIIHPLAQVLIFSLILSEILSAKLPGIDNKYAYALYLMSGTIAWNLFNDVITRFVTLFVDNAGLMKKMAFPRICLPVISAGYVLVNNLLLIAAVFLVFALLGHMPGIQVLWLPLLVAVNLLFACSIGLLLATLNVFIRDTGQVVPVVMQALFWLTPVVYMLSILPERLQHYFKLNPLYPLVTGYQNVLVFNTPPPLSSLADLCVVSLLIMSFALFLFRKAVVEMVDVL
ncbi:ABC transporter permease [Xanthomonas massiliensis]|jgi:lipopolysaccharide transport system permease protein|uniref:ABC transporter permease n=1 Tax=Xanthomonas massiliensis TaxID=1720302 RepID=UPI0008264C7B|nr:ABC transporter permease [Xanthomonas massiliensis]